MLDDWNGISPINDRFLPWTHPLHTDASGGANGGGAYFWAGRWLNYRHTRRQRKACLAYLELYAVYVALLRHGEEWQGCLVPLLCDNQTVVAVLRKGVSASPRINKLLQSVLEHCLRGGITLHAYWLSTHENKLADALSRFDMQAAAPLMQKWRQHSEHTLRLAVT
jgi:hypothetical protein